MYESFGIPRRYQLPLLVAIGVAWYLSSESIFIFLALFIAFDAVTMACRLRRDVALWQYTYLAPITKVYEFRLALGDRAWDALGLTPEERAVIQRSSRRPKGFVLEEWAQDLTRWRISQISGTETTERIVDLYGPQPLQADAITLWEVRLGEDGHPTVSFDWDGEHLLFSAWGGRFGGFQPVLPRRPGSYGYPTEEHTLFHFRLPLHAAVVLHDREEFDTAMREYRVQPEDGEAGKDVYRSKDEEKGYFWILKVHDLRPVVAARVVRLKKELWSRKLRGIKLKVVDTGHVVWADPSRVEPYLEEQRIPKRGETVSIVFGRGKVDRLWLGS